MVNYALISQNARKIMDKDSLMVVPKIEKKMEFVKSLKIKGGDGGIYIYYLAKTLIIYAEIFLRYRVMIRDCKL